MDTKVGIGISTRLDSFSAGKEAATRAYLQISRRYPEILIVFISPIFVQEEVIRGIRSVLRDVPLVGCSTAGSITSFGSFRNSVTVCALISNSISFSYGIAEGVSKNPRLAGSKLVKTSSDADTKRRLKEVFIMFSDCLSGNIAELLRGVQQGAWETSFPIIGGSASDDLRFQKAYQYLNDTIYTDTAVGILMEGPINADTGIAHGWQPIGRPHKITKARSNIVSEIDRRKAVELYEEYLNKAPDELKDTCIARLGSTYPLGIRIRERRDFLTRTPLTVNVNGQIMLNVGIQEHQEINLMIADKRLVLAATEEACREALKHVDRNRILFAIVFSDIARLQLLRRDAEKEVLIIKGLLGGNVPFFGCYTCGEYALTEGHDWESALHSQAVSITVISG